MHTSSDPLFSAGVRLLRARQRAGLSQTALGKRLGASQTTVSRLEKNKHYPRVELRECVRQFIDETERGSVPDAETLLEKIAGSEELRALVQRIITES